MAQDVEFFLPTRLCIDLGFYCCDQMSSLDQTWLYMLLILGLQETEAREILMFIKLYTEFKASLGYTARK